MVHPALGQRLPKVAVAAVGQGANIHDCDAAHIVVANIQQFARVRNRWYEALPTDYFDMILVDEGTTM